MPIDFNQQTFFDPKIDIIGREVPVAELEKTGEIQQKNYDESATNLNKIRELSDQVEQIADPAERQKVRDYIASMQPELEKISAGAIGEARHQTGYLANKAGSNLKLIEGRATEIAKIKNKIAEATAIGDADVRQYYENLLDKEIAKTTFDKDRGVFDFKAINMPNIVPSSDNNAFLAKAVATFKADTYGTEAANIKFFHKGDILPDKTMAQNDLAYDIKNKHIKEEVDFTHVYNNVLKMAEGEIPLQAHINRDVQIQAANHLEQTGVEYTPEELLKVKKGIERKLLYDPLTGHANAAAYTDVRDANDVGFNTGATGAITKPEVVPTVEDRYDSSAIEGEVSNTKTSFAEAPLDKLLDSKGVGIQSNFEEDPISPVLRTVPGSGSDKPVERSNFQPTQAGKTTLSWITEGLLKQALELKHSPNADDQLLYSKIMSSYAQQINVALKTGKPLNGFQVKKLQEAIKNGLNLPTINNYSFVGPTSTEFVADLDARFKKKAGDPIGQMEDLNAATLGHKDGIALNKDGKWNTGVTDGMSILNPRTGDWAPLTASLHGKGPIKLPMDEGMIMKINGKVIPGTVLHATKDSGPGGADLSYFGAGYLTSVNGEDFIVAKHGKAATESVNAKFNDLSGYPRVMRNENTYIATTSSGKREDFKIKSDGTDVFVTKAGKTITIPNEVFEYALQRISAEGKDPINYIYETAFSKPTKK